jgi:competence protein ComEA
MQISALFRIITIVFFLGLPAVFSASSSRAFAEEPPAINLNTASSFKLMKLDYISRELASSIVRYRDEFGSFKAPADLLKVPGMSQEILDNIEPKIDDSGALISTSITAADGNDDMAIPNY